MQMIKKHMKRCSTLTLTGEMQIKTEMIYYNILTKMTKTKMCKNTGLGEDMKQLKPLLYIMGCKIIQRFGK